MNAIETIRDVITSEQMTPAEASLKMGRKNTYIATIFGKERRDGKSSIQTDTLAQFCEALNYELLIRSKDDGTEFVIDE